MVKIVQVIIARCLLLHSQTYKWRLQVYYLSIIFVSGYRNVYRRRWV